MTSSPLSDAKPHEVILLPNTNSAPSAEREEKRMHGWRIIQTVQHPVRGVVGVEKSNVRRGSAGEARSVEVRSVLCEEGGSQFLWISVHARSLYQVHSIIINTPWRTGIMVELYSYSPSKSRVDWSRWHFDIDNYLNPFIPAPPWRWVPRPISHFLGYRGDQPPRVIGSLIIAFWALIGVFCGVSVVSAVTKRVPSFEHHHGPSVVASMGAAAVLEFAAIDSPFAQPRNAILSQVFASAIGIGIAKLFALNPHAATLPELSAPLACAIVTALMVLTNTSHPPAGATAVVAVTQSAEMGWFFMPVVILESVLMLAVALLINNIQRRYPVFWWTPQSLSRQRDEDIEKAKQEESKVRPSTSLSDQPVQIVVRREEVFVPDNVWITAEEREVLETISHRLK